MASMVRINLRPPHTTAVVLHPLRSRPPPSPLTSTVAAGAGFIRFHSLSTTSPPLGRNRLHPWLTHADRRSSSSFTSHTPPPPPPPPPPPRLSFSELMDEFDRLPPTAKIMVCLITLVAMPVLLPIYLAVAVVFNAVDPEYSAPDPTQISGVVNIVNSNTVIKKENLVIGGRRTINIVNSKIVIEKNSVISGMQIINIDDSRIVIEKDVVISGMQTINIDNSSIVIEKNPVISGMLTINMDNSSILIEKNPVISGIHTIDCVDSSIVIEENSVISGNGTINMDNSSIVIEKNPVISGMQTVTNHETSWVD